MLRSTATGTTRVHHVLNCGRAITLCWTANSNISSTLTTIAWGPRGLVVPKTVGVELLRRAIDLDPSNAQAHVALGAALIRINRFDEGIKSMQFGMRSSPRDFRLTFWRMILADAFARAGRIEDALTEAAAASRRDGRLYGSRVVSA